MHLHQDALAQDPDSEFTHTTIGWNLLMTKWSRVVPMAILLSAWGFVLLLMAFGSGPLMPVMVTV